MVSRSTLFAVGFILMITPATGQHSATPSDPQSILSHLPATFRQNLGQWDQDILFRSSHNGGVAQFLKNGVSYAFERQAANTGMQNMDSPEEQEIMVWNIRFINAQTDAGISPNEFINSNTNYIKGNDPGYHVTDVPDFKMITYQNIYPNTDLRYYPDEQSLKYDYVLAPGADIHNIKMQAQGVRSIDINRNGELEINTPWGTLIEKTPYSYQIIDGKIKEVDIRFDLKDNMTFGFRAYGDYDITHELIIDPVILKWSTFIASTASVGITTGYVRDIDVANNEDVYCVGFYRDNFPITPGVYQGQSAGGKIDATIFKLSADGSKLLFSTYLGGNDIEYGRGIKVNSKNEIFVVGHTRSGNFPTTPGAFKTSINGEVDLFALKMSPDGKKLLWSTFIGGSYYEDMNYEHYAGMELTPNDEIIFAGTTQSGNFPSAGNGYDKTFNGRKDVAVIKVKADGSGLVFSTFVGGSGDDVPNGIVADKNGNLYVCGYTSSEDFPTTTGVFGDKMFGFQDGFVFKMAPDGSNLKYSTYIGSTLGRDELTGIDVNDKGQVFVVGKTGGKDFPTTPGAFDRYSNVGLADPADALVFKLNATGSTLLYSTFLGGKAYDVGRGIKVSATDEAYVVGTTASDNFLVTSCAFDKTYHAGEDGFLVRFNTAGSKIIYSTLYGGAMNDYKERIVLSEGSCGVEKLWISLGSHSEEFPVTPGAYQDVRYTGTADVPTVFQLKPVIEPEFSFTAPSCNTPIQFTGASKGDCIWTFGPWTPTAWQWDFGDGITSTLQNPTHSYTSAGQYKVKLIVGACPKDSITKTITISGGTLNINPQIDVTDSECDKNNGTATVNASVGSYNYLWNDKNKQTTATASGLAPGTYNVTVSDPATCQSKTLSVTVKSFPESMGAIVQTTPANCGASDGSATVTASGGSGNYTYLWSDSAGQTTATATGLPSGTYQVTVKDKQGCPPDTTLTVIVTGQGQLNLETSATDAACGVNGTATVSVKNSSGNLNYEWDDDSGQTTATATGLPAGTYHVTVTDESGCTGTTEVTVNSSSDIDVFVPSTTIKGCDRFGAVNATAVAHVNGGTPPYSYQWDDPQNQTTDTATGLGVGTYIVIVTDKNGCTDRDSITIEEIIQININVDTDPCSPGCTDGQVTANVSGSGKPPYTYRWDDPGQQTTATATGLKPGVYTVTVFDDQDCSNTATVTIGGATGIEARDIHQLSVYPNPSTGFFHIDHQGITGKVNLKVRDIRGKLILNQIYVGIKERFSLDLNQYEDGVYLLELTTESGVMYRRIQLMR